MLTYADYAFYTEIHKGSLSQAGFDKNIVKASAYVRKITFGRADEHADDDEVKHAACIVCDIFAIDEKRRNSHQGMNITSENIDGYSISFVQEQIAGETAEELLNRKAYKAAEMFLMPTGLLNWEV
ncbi:MAG: hypothetical protein U0L05_01400 [Schaedlerella sp.]|nr:hypothetical protein [Schaedlerella sp.]